MTSVPPPVGGLQRLLAWCLSSVGEADVAYDAPDAFCLFCKEEPQMQVC